MPINSESQKNIINLLHLHLQPLQWNV